MKKKLLSLALGSGIAIIVGRGVMPCAAEEAKITKKESEASEKARHELIQTMTDRLINKKAQFSMVGPLQILAGNRYSVSGEVFLVDEQTRVQGRLASGSDVEVRGFLSPGQIKTASQVVVIENTKVAESSAVNAASSTPADLNTIDARGLR